jgi:hypothetical protein
MGLDMYLRARKYVSDYSYQEGKERDEFEGILSAIGLDREDIAVETPSAYVEVGVGYWRKANHIHNWFVENLADGVDDCKPVYVNRKDLVELFNITNEVMKIKEMQEANPEYDDWYWMQTEYTRDRLKVILENPKFEDYDFEYRASW